MSTTPTVTTTSTPTSYAVYVQIPIPFQIPNLAKFAGKFNLPQLVGLAVPKAYTSYLANAEAQIQNVINDATRLIKAVSNASFTIIVKLGPVVIANVKLVAVPTPLGGAVPIPKFKLALPNLDVNKNFSLALPVPPVVINVPVPVPRLTLGLPSVAITGGQVNAGASATINTPPPIMNPVYSPKV